MPIWLIVVLAVLAALVAVAFIAPRLVPRLVPVLQRTRIGRKILARLARFGMRALRAKAARQAKAAGQAPAPAATDLELALAGDDSEQSAAARKLLAQMSPAQRRQLDRMLASEGVETLLDGAEGLDEAALGRSARRAVGRVSASNPSRARQKAKAKAKRRAARKRK